MKGSVQQEYVTVNKHFYQQTIKIHETKLKELKGENNRTVTETTTFHIQNKEIEGLSHTESNQSKKHVQNTQPNRNTVSTHEVFSRIEYIRPHTVDFNIYHRGLKRWLSD